MAYQTIVAVYDTPAHAQAAVLIVFLFACMAAVLVGRLRIARWPCPRCGRRFFGGFWFDLAFKCPHCRLQKWR